MKMTIMKSGTILGLALLVGATGAQGQSTRSSNQAQRGQFSEKDYNFVAKFSSGGMEEVELGQLAAQKGVSEAVRNFGQRMVTDHGKANDALKQIVTQKGATLPTRLSRTERLTIDHLQNATGADFDKTYAQDMVNDQ